MRRHDREIMSGDEPEEQVAVVSLSCTFVGNGACRSAQDFNAERAGANGCAKSAEAGLRRRRPASLITSKSARSPREEA